MIVAGFGFRAGATVESLRAALAALGGGAEALAAPADRAAAACLAALAADLGLPVVAVPADRLAAQITHTRSHRILVTRSTGSVAEAAALAAAQPGARLVAYRVISPDRRATCALAQGDHE